MCQKSPGPRCAGHLREAITLVEAQVAANRDAYQSGRERPHPEAQSRLLQLRDEFDETPTGQRALAEQMVNSVGNPALVAALKHRQTSAARRYAVKHAALAATQAGDTRAANIILKTGNPDAGWLTHSRLNPLNAAAYRRLHLDPTGGYLIGVVGTDTETVYDPAGNATQIHESSLVFETPIEAGPIAGTYLTHATPASRQVTDPYLYTAPSLDVPAATLRPYDPVGRRVEDVPVSVAELADTGEVEALTGCSDADDATITWEEAPEVVHAEGRPVLLRFHGTATAYVSTGYRATSIA